MFKHICPACDGRGYAVEELPLAPAVKRDLAPDYRDVACRLLDKLEREGWRPDEVAAMTARIAELDDIPACIQTPAQADAWPPNIAEGIDPRMFIRRVQTALATRGLCLTADQMDAILKAEQNHTPQSSNGKDTGPLAGDAGSSPAKGSDVLRERDGQHG